MAGKEKERSEYGVYFAGLIKKRQISHADFAKMIGVSRTYLFDIFKARVKPPAPEMQEKIISVLGLQGVQKAEFYDKTAEGRGELPKDVFDYLYKNSNEIDAIRKKMRD